MGINTPVPAGAAAGRAATPLMGFHAEPCAHLGAWCTGGARWLWC